MLSFLLALLFKLERVLPVLLKLLFRRLVHLGWHALVSQLLLHVSDDLLQLVGALIALRKLRLLLLELVFQGLALLSIIHTGFKLLNIRLWRFGALISLLIGQKLDFVAFGLKLFQQFGH